MASSGFETIKSVLLCFLLSVTYVLSLLIWNSPYSRNHPSTIKKRFASAFIMLFISPCFLYAGLNSDLHEKQSFIEILGLRTLGLWQAVSIPLFLTMILFLGPISMEFFSVSSKDNAEEVNSNLTNLIWLRNYIVAPISEEFTYRSCMLPLLLQCFSPFAAILCCPLFFGVAHFHHIWERIHYMGMSFFNALMISVFQCTYTTLFGMYSAYLFYRTGHFASIVIVHAFCNRMGFPAVNEIPTYTGWKRIVIISSFLIGFVSWCFLIKPLTEADLYYHKTVL